MSGIQQIVMLANQQNQATVVSFEPVFSTIFEDLKWYKLGRLACGGVGLACGSMAIRYYRARIQTRRLESTNGMGRNQ
jgi:hypothetical protein